MNDLISVIIPVYNVELYLRECLDSVISGTYANLEIILVDDGSTDNCGEICDRYAAKDNRITVIHQKNRGLPAARNAGLACATGKYISFVDSDDVISKNMYEELHYAIEKEGADIAACEFTRQDNYSAQFDIGESVHEKSHVVTGVEKCLRVITNEPSTRNYTYTNCMVWNKLYCREKIQQLFAVEAVTSEDFLFNWDYIKACDKMAIVPKVLYYWRNNPESLTHKKSLDKQITIAKVWLNIAEEFSSITDSDSNIHDNDLKLYLYGRCAYWAHNALWNIVGKGKETLYPEFVEQTHDVINKYFKELSSIEDVEWKVRIPVILFRYCEPIWRCAAKLYSKKVDKLI